MPRVLQAPVVARGLTFYAGSCAELTPNEFHEVVLHFTPTLLAFKDSCRLCAGQITDEFIRALLTNGVLRVAFPNELPADGDRFNVTDHAIADFCVQGPYLGFGELALFNGRFTKDLFKRLIEVSRLMLYVR